MTVKFKHPLKPILEQRGVNKCSLTLRLCSSRVQKVLGQQAIQITNALGHSFDEALLITLQV